MSDLLPFELQVEILKISPVKSLLKFRSVSKAWKSLIDSSEFIAAHNLRHSQPQRLLLRCNNPMTKDEYYLCFVDDNTFPHRYFASTLPLSVRRLSKSSIVGSSQGLLCFFGYNDSRLKYTAVIWNPSIRKLIDIVVPNVLDPLGETVIGFGVCPVNLEPKIVKLTQVNFFRSWEVAVYTLTSGNWRILSTNLPRKSMTVTQTPVVVGNFIYWPAFDTSLDGECYDLILAFDLTNERFTVVDLPDGVAFKYDILSMCNPRESLAVVSYSRNNGNEVCEVWMMDHGVEISYMKLLTIKTPHLLMKPLGFRNCGELIMERTDFCKDIYKEPAIVVYEPELDRFKDLGISGRGYLFFLNSYMETLLLHNQRHKLSM